MTSDNKQRGCIVNISPRKNLVALCLAAILGIFAGESVHADHLLPRHALDCSENFPCPAALQPRVRFWIEVFSNWDSKTAILHDPNRPERVYAVFKSNRGCRGGTHSTFKRNQIRKSLRTIAAKIESGVEISGHNERHLARLFPAGNAGEIRAAAKNIRCQGGVRDSFVRGLKGYNRHRTMIDKVLAENGLPAEISYLPFVESSYNPAAYSKAGAAGMWQIMPKTARVLGLKLNAALDERRDPESATRAAAKYLRRADRILTAVARETNPAITRAQINPFIITSYNYGVTGMKRAIHKVEPNFMTVLENYKSPRFQIAVKNFYASFLAARHVARNASHYFGARAAEGGGGGRYQTVVLQHPTSIARIKAVFGLRKSELHSLNRALTNNVWRGWRLIPAGYRLRLPNKIDGWRSERAKLTALGREKEISRGDNYIVRYGDTACDIARAARVNCGELIRVNQLDRRASIWIGQKLLIPGKRGVVATASGERARTYLAQKDGTACGIARRFGVGCHIVNAKLATSSPEKEISYGGNYIVRYGDTACNIARSVRVNCGELIRVNQLDRRATIRIGQKLRIPGKLGVAATASGEGARTYLAQKDGTACGIARRFGVGCHIVNAKLATSSPEKEISYGGNYIVRRGDTACNIARSVRVNCGELIRVNQLDRRATIRIGQKLRIPGKLGVAATVSGEGARTYLAKKDGTACGIARRFEVGCHTVSAELATISPEKEISYGANYIVRRGDTACNIARSVRVNCGELIRVNQLDRRATIRIGQKLRIPGKLTVAATASGEGARTYLAKKDGTACGIARRFEVGCHTVSAELATISPEKEISYGANYIVRRGDTACNIARSVRVNCGELIRVNQLDRRATIRIGQKLRIPGKLTVAATVSGEGARTYLAKKDGTACGIARRFEVGCHTVSAELATISPEKEISYGANYIVRRGDTACNIARSVRVNCGELIRVNQLDRRATIRIGQKLRIPGKLVVAATASGEGARTYLAQKDGTACGIARRFEVGCHTVSAELATSSPEKEISYGGNYIVRRGDTACNIARSVRVNCGELIRANQLDRRATIRIGQKLRIPGKLGVAATASGEGARTYLAQKDGTACGIARRFGAGCHTVSESVMPKASRTALLLAQVGAVQSPAPGVPAGDLGSLINLLDTLPDLGIIVSGSPEEPVYTVRVEADETLGHFADWLGIGGAGALRRLNHLHRTQPITIGRRLALPWVDAKTAERFVQLRSDYHQVLSDSLKEHYNLAGIESYSIKKGDSPWSLSQQMGFPVWLLYRLNPGLRATQLKPGQLVSLPKLREKV